MDSELLQGEVIPIKTGIQNYNDSEFPKPSVGMKTQTKTWVRFHPSKNDRSQAILINGSVSCYFINFRPSARPLLDKGKLICFASLSIKVIKFSDAD